MPKKNKAPKSTAAPSTASVAAPPEPPGDVATEAPVHGTFTAASGKFFAVTDSDYPEQDEIGEEFTFEVLEVAHGDLLEVLLLHGDWGYGRRFKARQGKVNEGVFRLEWVHG